LGILIHSWLDTHGATLLGLQSHLQMPPQGVREMVRQELVSIDQKDFRNMVLRADKEGQKERDLDKMDKKRSME
jgi:hypothetical protein